VNTRRKTFMKRLVYLATAALVAMLILVPVAVAQELTTESTTKMVQETTQPLPATGGQEGTQPLPKSGGPVIASPTALLLPAAALLVGAGILGYAVLRRR
jgi:hypothetical protein